MWKTALTAIGRATVRVAALVASIEVFGSLLGYAETLHRVTRGYPVETALTVLAAILWHALMIDLSRSKRRLRLKGRDDRDRRNSLDSRPDNGDEDA